MKKLPKPVRAWAPILENGTFGIGFPNMLDEKPHIWGTIRGLAIVDYVRVEIRPITTKKRRKKR